MSELHQIGLAIQQPVHEQVFVGVGSATTVTVPLRGSVVATTFPNPAALFRKWYSNLATDPLATTDQASAALAVGSHVITYTVKDKNEDGVPSAELEALFNSIEHVGASGGPPQPPPADGRPCVIHVLIANILAPAEGAVLSKAGAILEAEAPLQWGKYVEDTPNDAPPDQRRPAVEYPERDPAYHAVNKLHYRWSFQRLAGADAPIHLGAQAENVMVLIPPHRALQNPAVPQVDPPPRLRYKGPLPAALVAGQQYTVTLRVEHIDNPAQGHAVSRTVTIVA